jgi:DNA-directed RNA polymerase sigma subunit (sigma70/sigma32)
MKVEAWDLCTKLSAQILPNTTFSRSQVVQFALTRLANDVKTINPNVTNEGGFVNNVGELCQPTDRDAERELRRNSKAPDPEYIGTPSTDAEVIARNKNIFHHRCVAKDKLTLQQLGTCYNLSRERVRQIQELMENEVSTETLKQTNEEKHAS